MKNNRNASLVAVIALLGITCTSFASADTGACVSHLVANINGEEVDHRDCVQNVSQPAEVFRQGCQETAEQSDMIAADGLPGVEIHKQSTEYVSAGCPANPQGSCNGVSDGEVNFLYWDRTPEQLAQTRQGCGMLGGVWKE